MSTFGKILKAQLRKRKMSRRREKYYRVEDKDFWMTCLSAWVWKYRLPANDARKVQLHTTLKMTLPSQWVRFVVSSNPR